MAERRIDDDEAARLYAGGYTIRAIAEVLDVGITTVNNALRRAGTNMRARGRRPSGRTGAMRATAAWWLGRAIHRLAGLDPWPGDERRN